MLTGQGTVHVSDVLVETHLGMLGECARTAVHIYAHGCPVMHLLVVCVVALLRGCYIHCYLFMFAKATSAQIHDDTDALLPHTKKTTLYCTFCNKEVMAHS